jgi:hypothetical protein
MLAIWHDEIVKPAFDRAWEDSGLKIAQTRGVSVDMPVRILAAGSVTSVMDALPFSGFKTRLANYTHLSIAGPAVSTSWPPHSPVLLAEAWQSITGMLNDHPDMQGWQDPVMLAVWEEDVVWNEETGMGRVYESVAREWERVIDARYVVQGSLRVIVETVVGIGEGMGRKRKEMDDGEEEGEANVKIDIEGEAESEAEVEEKIDGDGKMETDEGLVDGEVKQQTGKEGVEEKGDTKEEGHRGKRRKVERVEE